MMAKSVLLAATAALLTMTAACSGGSDGAAGGNAGPAIRVVGSSTVYPFSTAVSEIYAKANAGATAPIVESTGTGAGIKLFCAGVGSQHPDIANASRRMKKAEFETCQKNGVTEITEVQIGLDGLAFAESAKGAKLALTPAIIYKALAANPFGKPQTAKTWADVDPSLPANPIRVYGPPSTSGTRDALAELILTKGCEADPAMKALKDKDADAHKKACTAVREDGAYIDAGENDNLIVQKLEADPKAVGVFGYSFLEENAERLHGNTINGIAPSYATITDFSYPGARPLYIYVKKGHLNAKKGLRDYVAAFATAWGKDGPLQKRGMVVAPDDVLAAGATAVKDFPNLDGAALN